MHVLIVPELRYVLRITTKFGWNFNSQWNSLENSKSDFQNSRCTENGIAVVLETKAFHGQVRQCFPKVRLVPAAQLIKDIASVMLNSAAL